MKHDHYPETAESLTRPFYGVTLQALKMSSHARPGRLIVASSYVLQRILDRLVELMNNCKKFFRTDFTCLRKL